MNMIILVGDLMPGTVLASGHVVERVETGGRHGDSVHVTFANGATGTVSRHNRIWVRSGTVVPHREEALF